jgi:hypothetical protein
VSTYLLRLLLPDRPGALGAVASRVGALRGDVVDIEVLDRSNGIARDQLMIDLPSDDLLSLLAQELGEVDGVAIEHVVPLDSSRDHRFDAYDTAAALLEAPDHQAVLEALAERTKWELDATWCTLVDMHDRVIVALRGDPPLANWLCAYLEGTHGPQREHLPSVTAESATRSSRGEETGGRPVPSQDKASCRSGASNNGCRDIAAVELAAWDLVLAVGRPEWPFHPTEVRRLDAIARLADARWADMHRRAALAHPVRM